MPRRKSQPAKYYHCMNDAQNEGVSSENYGLLPEASTEVQESSDNSENRDSQSTSESSPASEDCHNFLETCKSEETEDDNIHNFKPISKRRRMVSPKKENYDVCKNEDMLNASFDFTQRNGDQLGNEKKEKISKLSEDHKSDDVKEKTESPQAQAEPVTPKRKSITVLDHVYLLITYYVQRSLALESALQNEEFHLEDSNDTSSNNQETVDVKPKLEIDETSASPNSLQDTGSSCKNEVKLSEEEMEESKVNTDSIPDGGSGNNEKVIKRNGSISSELEQCGVCLKFLKRSSMREHMERHNDSGRYRCSVCRKTFSKLSSFEKHELIHTDERPFKCDQCDKAYRQKIHLVEHMRTHSGIRPFHCSYCNYSFGSRSLLNRHVKTHGKNKTPEKESGTLNLRLGSQQMTTPKKDDTPKKMMSEKRCIEPLKQKLKSRIANNHFDCSICHSQFASEKLLSSHLLSEHQLVTGFKCSKCTTTFSAPGDLAAHMNDAHKSSQAYPCPDCTKAFAHSSSLLKHRVKEHGHRSSSLVQVMPSARKGVHDNIRLGDDEPPSERNGNNSDTAFSRDKSSPVPIKVPRLSLVNGNEGKVDSPSIEKADITKFTTPKCEISGSDM